MTKNHVSITETSELDDDRLAAANAIRFWWDTKPSERENFANEIMHGLECVNKYQARLCTLLGIAVQEVTEMTMDTGILIIKEPVLGMSTEARITLHYWYPHTSIPYKLWVKEGSTILGIVAYSTQDLIARIHDAHCIMQLFGEGRPHV